MSVFSPDIFAFDEFAGSGRGLLARPVMPNNVVALREHIETISYEVHNLNTGDPPVTGDLDPLQVMLPAPSGKNTWNKDTIGFTFVWPAPGTLWPDPDVTYRIIVKFRTTAALGSKEFLRVWQVSTKDPDTA